MSSQLITFEVLNEGNDGARSANRRMQLLLDLPLSGSHGSEVETEAVALERARVQGSRYGMGPRRTVTSFRCVIFVFILINDDFQGGAIQEFYPH